MVGSCGAAVIVTAPPGLVQLGAESYAHLEAQPWQVAQRPSGGWVQAQSAYTLPALPCSARSRIVGPQNGLIPDSFSGRWELLFLVSGAPWSGGSLG